MTFQEKLSKFFKDQNITQIEVAEITGYSPTMIGRYFNKLDPNYKFIQALEINYDLDWNYLLKDSSFVNEAGEPYQKDPKRLLREIEIRVHQLKQWHKNDSQNE
jgi:transcriptional regulator with XRE-family HTH domain